MGHSKVNSEVQSSLVAGDWKGKGAERWKGSCSHSPTKLQKWQQSLYNQTARHKLQESNHGGMLMVP